MRSADRIATYLVLALSTVSAGLLLFTAADIRSSWVPVLSVFFGAIIFCASVIWKKFPLIHLSLFFLLLFGWRWSPFWPEELPTGLLVPFLVYILIVLFVPALRKSATWFNRGRFDRKSLLASLGVLVFSLPALLIWAIVSGNNIENYIYLFHPRILLIELLIFAFLFALISAVTQEIVFRGIFQDALGAAFGPGLYALLVQAIVFGIIHSMGIPSGIAGVIMAFTYGCMLGILRNLSGGLLLPVIVHFITDLFIFGLIFYKADLEGLLSFFPLL